MSEKEEQEPKDQAAPPEDVPAHAEGQPASTEGESAITEGSAAEPPKSSGGRTLPLWLQLAVFLFVGAAVIVVLGSRWVQSPWSLEKGFEKLESGMNIEEVREVMGRESDSAQGLLVWWTKSTGGSPQTGIRRIQGTELSITYAAWFENGRLVRKKRFEAFINKEALRKQGGMPESR